MRIDSTLKNVLIINPFGIGDVLFTTPLIHSIKDLHPDIKIGYLCNRRAKEVIKNNPFVDTIFVYERDEFEVSRKGSFFIWVRKLHSLFSDIKKGSFDAALDFSLNTQYGFLCWIAGIRKRYGYDYKKRGRYLTHKIGLDGYNGKHIVEYYASLLRYIGIDPKFNNLELYLDPEDQNWARDLLVRQGIKKPTEPVIVIPGAGASWGKDAYLKRWRAENFAKLSDNIVEKYQVPIIIMGDSFDRQVCDLVKSGMRHEVIDLCAKTELGKFAALLNCARLIITNDGGPLHMAAALNKKTVSFFGPVDPKVYGPYPVNSQRHIVLRRDLECSPCYRNFRLVLCEKDKECLEKIDIAQAMQAVDALLSGD